MEYLKDILNTKYGIQDIQSIEKLEKRSTNNLYIVKTKSDKLFFKELFKFKNQEEAHITAQIDIVEHMKKKGLNTVVPLKNSENSMLTKVSDKYYLLYPYLEIDQKPTITEEHFNNSIKALAEFHKQMKDFKVKNKFHTKPLHKNIIDITGFTEYDIKHKETSVIKKINEIEPKTEFCKKILNDSQLIQSAIIKVLHNLKNAKFTQKTILHYDYNRENVFFKPNTSEIIAISDFDYSHNGYVEADLAKAAKYWSANEEDSEIDIEKYKRFITKYREHNTASNDWKLYHTLTLYVVLRRLVYACQYTLSGRANLEFLYDKDIKMIKYLLDNEEKFN